LEKLLLRKNVKFATVCSPPDQRQDGSLWASKSSPDGRLWTFAYA
jgi:hypothetical protein